VFFSPSKSSTAAAAATASFNFVVPTDDGYGQDDAEVAARLILNPNFGSKLTKTQDIKTREMFFSDMDSFLNFDYSNNSATR